MDQITPNFPSPGGGAGRWGDDLNGVLAQLTDKVNEIVQAFGQIGAGAFVLYDPSSGWPAVDADTDAVFVSLGAPTAPAPTGGSANSLWWGSNA
jgi:hypothetical protein